MVKDFRILFMRKYGWTLEQRLNRGGFVLQGLRRMRVQIVKAPPPPEKPKAELQDAPRSSIQGFSSEVPEMRFSLVATRLPAEDSDFLALRTQIDKRLQLAKDEGFSTTLRRMIGERRLWESEVYQRAGIDKRHFAKIRKERNYKPSRKTVFAFAFALKLNREELSRLMLSAGMALSPSDPFDIVIGFLIDEGICDLLVVDQVLDFYDLPLLLQHREVTE